MLLPGNLSLFLSLSLSLSLTVRVSPILTLFGAVTAWLAGVAVEGNGEGPGGRAPRRLLSFVLNAMNC